MICTHGWRKGGRCGSWKGEGEPCEADDATSWLVIYGNRISAALNANVSRSLCITPPLCIYRPVTNVTMAAPMLRPLPFYREDPQVVGGGDRRAEGENKRGPGENSVISLYIPYKQHHQYTRVSHSLKKKNRKGQRVYMCESVATPSRGHLFQRIFPESQDIQSLGKCLQLNTFRKKCGIWNRECSTCIKNGRARVYNGNPIIRSGGMPSDTQRTWRRRLRQVTSKQERRPFSSSFARRAHKSRIYASLHHEMHHFQLDLIRAI